MAFHIRRRIHHKRLLSLSSLQPGNGPPPKKPAEKPARETKPSDPKEQQAEQKPSAQEPSVSLDTRKAYQVGFSSYYAHKFHGRPTASGEIFDMNDLTAAHRELPLGTVIRVTHMGNGRKVTVKVNDRGPFIEGRILDLSLGAAKRLGMVQEGVAKVMIEIVKAIN